MDGVNHQKWPVYDIAISTLVTTDGLWWVTMLNHQGFTNQCWCHRIGWWEHLQDNSIFHGKKTMALRLRFSLQSWVKKWQPNKPPVLGYHGCCTDQTWRSKHLKWLPCQGGHHQPEQPQNSMAPPKIGMFHEWMKTRKHNPCLQIRWFVSSRWNLTSESAFLIYPVVRMVRRERFGAFGLFIFPIYIYISISISISIFISISISISIPILYICIIYSLSNGGASWTQRVSQASSYSDAPGLSQQNVSWQMLAPGPQFWGTLGPWDGESVHFSGSLFEFTVW